jgi:hypothetical protein
MDVWGGVGDKLFGVSLTGEKAGQFLIATMAGWGALSEYSEEDVALWRLAVWARGMADELERADTPNAAQFFRSATEADEKLVGGEACSLLRELLGDPFHPIGIAPAWRDPAIQELAAAVYGDPRQPLDVLDPRRLAALARALEGAEGDNAEVLSHLRGPGPHVRGCWAVDAILGKE